MVSALGPSVPLPVNTLIDKPLLGGYPGVQFPALQRQAGLLEGDVSQRRNERDEPRFLHFIGIARNGNRKLYTLPGTPRTRTTA